MRKGKKGFRQYRFHALVFMLLTLGLYMPPCWSQKAAKSAPAAEPKVLPRPPVKKQDIGADYKQAKLIRGLSYGPTLAPAGPGEKNEFQSTPKDLCSFEKEHNSAWYLFTARYSGELTFEIVPENPDDDYDFLLFAYDSSGLAELSAEHPLKPVRSNLAHNDRKNNGITGLSSAAALEFVGQGNGSPFSKSIEVKAGDTFCLVLDNVHDKGAGHSIYFHFPLDVEISGEVKSEYKEGIRSDISVIDQKGQEVLKAETDKQGKYDIHSRLDKGEKYTMVITNDSSFLKSQPIDLSRPTNQKFTNITTVLHKLKKGYKYALEGINFLPDSDELKPESISSVNALAYLLKKNRKMIIRIEGHSNIGQNGSDAWGKKISTMRAKKIFDMLSQMGIEESRMTYLGFGSKYPLYPDPKNRSEEDKNRRVEINVISIK